MPLRLVAVLAEASATALPRVLRVLPGAAAAPGLALGGVDPLAVAAHIVLRVGGDGPHVESDELRWSGRCGVCKWTDGK